MKYRVYPCVAFLALALPTLVARATERQGVCETSGTQEIVTVDSMRSVVLGLVGLGWDDFLLKSQNELGLSTSQAQKLVSLRLGFSEATEEVEKRLEEARQALYNELDRVQVATREVEAQVRWLSALRGELVVPRFRYLLRAINVLSCEQHQKLAALLQLQRLLPDPPVWDEPYIEPQTAYPEALPYAAFQLAQYKYPDEERRRTEAGRCSSQASVSVDALLGYEPGRAAARKLMKLADQLRKHAESGSSVDQQTTHELLMQMQPEFWLMEWTNRELRSLIDRSPDEQLSRTAERLRVRPIADELIKAMQELNRNDSDTTALAQHAKQLKELVRQWRRGVKQAGKTLCLKPPHVSLLQ